MNSLITPVSINSIYGLLNKLVNITLALGFSLIAIYTSF